MSTNAALVRLRQALEMADLGFHMMRESLRRKFPNATAAELSEKYADWITSRSVMSGTDLKAIRIRRPSQQTSRVTTRGTRREP